ncbi:Zn-dependent protease [Stella humosa]|uniref:Zn-dependent protease n=1 Tax=Stella humosa TaxID=94 RepID=A0A3N1MFB5_9PROT|nr:site-2 protease family protein [Stella humosa]ROP99885.1 Zn-dependent protease [Stella humosa]BBK30885.1 peptidase M48 [Stella humosa]
MDDLIFTISVWTLPVLVAITFHEAAHGFVARLRGDDTAWRLGRVTFNPLKHIDLFGTIILPATMLAGSLAVGAQPFLFGFAKPVPVDFSRLDNPRYDMVLVALAGPGINIVLALAAAILGHMVPVLPSFMGEWALFNLVNAIQINVLLAVFNMLPLPPLDGGRVAVGLLPAPLAYPLARLERHGFFILLGLLFVLPFIGQQVGLDLNVLQWLIRGPTEYIIEMVLTVTAFDPLATLSAMR